MKKNILAIILIGGVFFAIFLKFLTVSSAHNNYLIHRQFDYLSAFMTIRCSENSPFFLRKILARSIYQDALSNQITLQHQGKIFSCISGWQDKEKNKLLTADHDFKYASITKLFTADLILQLVNDKKIKLSDKLPQYFNLNTQLKDERLLNITILDLLRHSAGFDRNASEDKIFNNKAWCDQNINQYLKNTVLDFSPTEKMVYSNESYCLLSKILEKVHGLNFNDIIKKNYSNYNIKTIYSKDLNETYYNHYFSPVNKDYYNSLYLENLTGSANLVGTAEGLVSAISEMIQRKPFNILNKQYLLECDIEKLRSCYGLGLSPIKYKDGLIYNRDGVMPGVTTYSFVTEDQDILVLLTNSNVMGGFENSAEFKKYIVSQLYLFKNKSKYS